MGIGGILKAIEERLLQDSVVVTTRVIGDGTHRTYRFNIGTHVRYYATVVKGQLSLESDSDYLNDRAIGLIRAHHALAECMS